MSRHLLILSPGFPKDEADTACLPVVQAYLKGLRNARPDWKITVMALQYPYHSMPYSWHGCRVIPLSGNNQFSRRPLVFARALARRLPKVDLIHSMWLTDASLLGQWIARLHKIPQIATLMGQDAHRSNRYLRWLNLTSMQVVPLSERSAEAFAMSTGYQASSVIPIGIAAEEIGGLPAKNRTVDLLFVGSLIPLKRPELFVELVHRLRSRFPHLQARMIGAGPEMQRLRKQIQENKLEKNLELLGEVPRPQVLQKMGESRILVVNSEQEGMGYVLLEALARGAYVVSTPVGIAENSRKCRLTNSLSEMVEVISGILKDPADDRPEVPIFLEDSIQRYLRRYDAVMAPSGRGINDI